MLNIGIKLHNTCVGVVGCVCLCVSVCNYVCQCVWRRRVNHKMSWSEGLKAVHTVMFRHLYNATQGHLEDFLKQINK